MNFDLSDKVQGLRARVGGFMDEHIYPAERDYDAELDRARRAGDPWQPVAVMEALKQKAREAGLWNLFLHEPEHGPGLSNLEYAPICELMGRSPIGAEPFNCSAPDTGNMETLVRYGTPEQKAKWLGPLLDGTMRSAFAMTEPDVGSSDATNIEARIERQGDDYVINGRKWWTSGANDPRCKIIIFMGKTEPDHPNRHQQQSMVLVPMGTHGVTVLRHLPVFGYDDAPHGHAEVLFENVRVPVTNVLLGEGRGFEIAQGRLGPGRIHHCMRLIGRAERALEMMCRRSLERVAFGRKLSDQGVTRERIANARIMIDQTRLLVLNAAHKMDTLGNKHARQEIAMIKVAAPQMACQVIDWAMQLHGGGSLSDDFGLARAYATSRATRFMDGPDEVHRNTVAKVELARYLKVPG